MLWKSLFRELWKSKGQYAAVAFTVLLGVAFFVGSYLSYKNLEASYEHSYERLRFEHLGVRFKFAPERVTRRIAAIPGVAAVEGRAVDELALEVTRRNKQQVVGRLIGIPLGRELRVNALKVTQGRGLSPRFGREVLLEASFAKFHRLAPGDQLALTQGSSVIKLRVAGIAQSPEYVYVVRSKQDLFPQPGSFGILWMDAEELGQLLNRSGLINEVRLRLSPGAKAQRVASQIKQALSEFDPEDPVLREDQPSYEMLRQDLEGFQSYSVLFPALFFIVSSLTLYALLMRIIDQQRPMIGLLRGLGYARRRVLVHYLSLATGIGVISGFLGVAAGFSLAVWATRAYLGYGFIAVAYPATSDPRGALLVGFLLGVGVCMLSSVFPAYAAARIAPLEALRGSRPTFSRSFQWDKWLPVPSLRMRIPLRSIFRQPKRTLASLVGIVSGLALIVTGFGLLDSMNLMINEMISGFFRDDLRASFLTPATDTQLNRVRHWKGVDWAEGSLEVPVVMRRGDRKYDALILGIADGSRAWQPIGPGNRRAPIPQEGLLVGPTIQKRLHLRKGDWLELELPATIMKDLKSRPKRVRVGGFTDESIGTLSYLPRSEVWRLFHTDLAWPPGAVTSILVKTDGTRDAEVRRRLSALSSAVAVTSIADYRRLVDNLVSLSRQFILVMLAFGSALAFAIVFSMVSVNMGERRSEIATLRTLGMRTGEIAGMVLTENFLVSVIGIAIGLPVGKQLAYAFMLSAQSEEQMDLFRMKIFVEPHSFVGSTLLIMVVMLIAQIGPLLSIRQLDLVRLVKERSG